MSNEIPTTHLELTGDFHLYSYADAAARQMNGQEGHLEPIVVRVDWEKTDQDENLAEGDRHFLVEGIRRGMKARFHRTLAEVQEAVPRRSHLGEL